jgi:hypothetical protein
MPTECSKDELFGDKEVIDRTNRSNEFQGDLRYGKLDISDMVKRIKSDVWKFSEELPQVCIAVTHVNERKLPEISNVFYSTYYSDGETRASVFHVS